MTEKSDRDPIREVEVLRKRFGEAINPSVLEEHNRRVQEMNNRIQEAINPPALQAIQEHMTRMQEMNNRIQEAINPPAVKAFMDLSQTFSMVYGSRLSGYAESVGRSVVERADRVPELATAEEEARYTQQFESLKLTPAEITVLYWVFAVLVSMLAGGAAGLNEEAASALLTLLGFLMFFLAIETRFRKRQDEFPR